MHPRREQLFERAPADLRADVSGARRSVQAMSIVCADVWDDY
jgi:hypothetical protein